MVSQRTVSPLSDRGSATPGCTDYTPRHEQFLKQQPQFAPQNAKRFTEHRDKEEFSNRPHVYEDPNQRTFRRSNSGSFTRAKRFSSGAIIDSQKVRAYLLTLKNSSAHYRQQSMGNLGLSSASRSNKFTISGAQVNRFDTNANFTTLQEVRSKTRPSTEVGRQRGRPQTEPLETTALGGDGPNQQSPEKSNKKQGNPSFMGGKSSLHTPRFSVTNRNARESMVSADSALVSTPGPACYETRVDSCVRDRSK